MPFPLSRGDPCRTDLANTRSPLFARSFGALCHVPCVLGGAGRGGSQADRLGNGTGLTACSRPRLWNDDLISKVSQRFSATLVKVLRFCGDKGFGPNMSTKVRTYIALVVIAGLSVLAESLSQWRSGGMAEFLIYGVVAAAAAALKVQLPGITGTMSVSYIFVLASVVHLTPGQVVCVAVMASLVQVFWQAAKRPTLAQALFNPSSMAVSAWVSSLSYQACPASLSLIFRMAIAGMTYFLVNTLSISGVVAMTEGKRIITVWRTCYFWSFPYYLVGASLATLISYVSRYVGWQVALGVTPIVFIIYRSYRLYLTQLQTEKQHAEAMAALHLRTIEALALAIEAKDHTTGTHLRRVQVYAGEIANELKLSEDEKQALQAASILHDIGKLAVPDYIISKPGKLTPEEFEKMKIHPIVGAEILERIDFPYSVVPVVRAHHEKWDGSGYPYGLRGEEIPIGARILSAVDCLDALATDRQYRKALPLDEALEFVKTESGKAYDPRVVEVLARRYRELERLAWSQPATEKGMLSTEIKIERRTTFSLPSQAPARKRRGSSNSPRRSGTRSALPTPSRLSPRVSRCSFRTMQSLSTRWTVRSSFRHTPMARTQSCSHRSVSLSVKDSRAGWRRTGNRSSTAIHQWSPAT